MTDFKWIGDTAILYKGKICQLTEHDGWEVYNAMRRVDDEQDLKRERLKKELMDELLTEIETVKIVEK